MTPTAAVLMRLNATINQNTSWNTPLAPSPIYKGKLIKRLESNAAPVPSKQAAANVQATVFIPLRKLYTIEGSKIYADVIKIFAISPTPPDELPSARKPSFKTQTITPSTGPSKKEMSKINTFPKSSFKNGVAGKSGISNQLTA